MSEPHSFSLCWWRASAHGDTKAAQAPKQQHFTPTLCVSILRKSTATPPGTRLPEGCWRGALTPSLHPLLTLEDKWKWRCQV